MSTFEVIGGNKLNGTVKISGSKNAVLPILAACLLTKEECVLRNVPDIEDVHTFLTVLGELGVENEFKKNTVKIRAQKINSNNLPEDLVRRMRASILFLAPLLIRNKYARMPFPGGCVLGKRPIDSHVHVFKKLGAKVVETDSNLEFQLERLKNATIIMPEMSVTATENAVTAAVLAPGTTRIRLAAAEPHVQDLCIFLNSMGAKIKGIGTHTLEIEGVGELHGADHYIVSDYLEAGTLAIAAVITGGEVTLTDIETEHLDSFWQKLKSAGAKIKLKGKEVTIFPSQKLRAISVLKTAVYPGFPTDLQAPFAVLLTQAEGQSQIFETLFEDRLNYLFELEKMRANIKIAGSHQGIIIGPTKLKASTVASCDIRAGAAVVLASLIAEGATRITNVDYIDRGYENLDKKLKKLGANIKRM